MACCRTSICSTSCGRLTAGNSDIRSKPPVFTAILATPRTDEAIYRSCPSANPPLNFPWNSALMRTVTATAAVLLYLFVAFDRGSEGRAQSGQPAPAAPAGAGVPAQTAKAPVSPQRALIDQYCMGCHSDRMKSGGLALSELNLDAAAPEPRLPRKCPQAARRSDAAGRLAPPGQSVCGRVRHRGSRRRSTRRPMVPRPGRVPLRRLNRREYANAVRDLTRLKVDAKALLPDDNVKGHFDNNAAALQVSPSFVDQYIYAARAVAREAIGNPQGASHRRPPTATSANMVISLPPGGAPGTGRQQHRLKGMPFGTRGGMTVEHNFPAEGEYELTIGDMALAREVPRMEFENTVIALLDGKEFYRTTIGGDEDHKAIDQRLDPAVEEINGRLRKIKFRAPAGSTRCRSRSCTARFAESDERTRTSGARRRAGAHPGRSCAADPRAARGGRHGRVAEPREDLHLRAESARRRSGVREPDRREPRARAFRRPVTAEDVDSADGVLQVGQRDRWLRRRRARRAQRHPGEPAFPLSRRSRRRDRGDPHAHRSGAGVAAVLLPVEQPARRRAAEARHRVASQQTRGPDRAGRRGCSPTRAPSR